MSKFYVGQSVYCLVFGEGVVNDVFDSSGTYPILAKFSNDASVRYTNDGRMFKGRNVCLYTSKPEIIVPKWQPKEGEWCWFWDEDDVSVFIIQQFSRMVGEGYCGTTGTRWDNCAPFIGELPEHLKEVEK
jgi:hypothetical protein